MNAHSPQFKDAFMGLRSSGSSSSAELSSGDEAELRALFDAIDVDKSGTIEMDEYFMWTLDVASRQGCGLSLIFKKYDKQGDGCLDANEFALAVEDLGFAAGFAHELFVDLDEDGSGSLTIDEVRTHSLF